VKNQLRFDTVTTPSPRVEIAQEEVSRARDTDHGERLRDFFEKVCAIRSRKVVAYELDVQPSQLSDSLTGNGGKQLQLRWLPTLARLCPPELKAELRAILLDLVDDEVPLTPEEELAQLRAAVLADMGAAGARLVEAAGRRRKARG